MQWSEEDTEALRAFKDRIDCDDIKVKEQIKQILLNNRFIVHVLNNKELEEADAIPEDYFYENIKPFYLIPDVQSATNNYLCYEVTYRESESRTTIGYNNRRNPCVKVLNVIFYILCHQEDLRDEDTDVARHDLLASLIYDQFNYTTYIGGGRLRLLSDVASTTDNKFATRTLTFEQITDANIVKTVNGEPKIINKEFQSHV